jgi:hypothetical protein
LIYDDHDIQFAWAAGLFEGEGCISLSRSNKGDHVRDVRLTVVNTDLDVLERFQATIGRGSISEMNSKSNLGSKQRWQWRLSRQVDVALLLRRMMPFLGQRRAAKARAVLDYIDYKRLPEERIVRVDL